MRKLKRNTSNKTLQIKRILVPFDFSECSSNALREAIFMAKVFMAKIDLLHVVTPVYVTASSSSSLLPFNDTYYQRIMKRAEKLMLDISREISNKEAVDINYKTTLNTVYDGILNYANKIKADLIVMGTHGTSGVREYFAGSNAYRVVNEALCPVITVQKKITKKGFKTIVLPIRSELNSRQKVNLVSFIAKSMFSKVLIVGYAENKSEARKVKQYAKQVQEYLQELSINSSNVLIEDNNFTKSIIKYAQGNKADLIAIMKNHDFSLDQLLKGSYAQQFVNHSKIPVLAIPNTIEFEYQYQNPLLGGLYA